MSGVVLLTVAVVIAFFFRATRKAGPAAEPVPAPSVPPLLELQTAPPVMDWPLVVAETYQEWQTDVAEIAPAPALVGPSSPAARPPSPAPAAPAAPAAKPVEKKPAPAPAPVPAPVRPAPSVPFQAYVGGLRVSGVLHRERVRAVIDGRTVFAGDMVDAKLGVRLVEADLQARLLWFEDSRGSRLSLPY